MAGKGFIDVGVRSQFNRSARGNIQDSEGNTESKQSIRNNQVITGARAKAASPAVPPLTRPTPPPSPPATDTSAPNNAVANITAAIQTRPSPPVVAAPVPQPIPAPVLPPAPPIFIPPSIPDVQATPQTLGAPPQNTEVLDVPAPIESLPLGPIDIDIITEEGGSGGDEVPPIPPIESFPAPPPINPTVQSPPPVEEVIEDIIEQTLQTPKDEAPIPVQSTVQIPEPKPSTPVVPPPPPPVKKSTDTLNKVVDMLSSQMDLLRKHQTR